MSAETPAKPLDPSDAAPPPAAPACQNCGAELLGPHCYRCGQPVKGLVRHFTSIIGDFFDSVFDFDSRTLRTLWPLFARPGYLTCEYFEGRRVRYVSPVRLFFFLAIVAFFVASLTLQVEGSGVDIDTDAPVRAPSAAAAAEAASIPEEATPADATTGDDDDADDDYGNHLSFGDGQWHPEKNPVEIGFLPQFGNDWVNRQIGRAERNIARLKEEPDLYVRTLLGAIPATLFVLMPLFAVLLKAAYVFKRRLYMEHLIVALHSHAFLCLSLLLLFLVGAIQLWVPVLDMPLAWVAGLLMLWMPVYLLLMQKRVYRQGWPMTLLKYFLLGACYTILLTLGLAVVSLGSLVWM